MDEDMKVTDGAQQGAENAIGGGRKTKPRRTKQARERPKPTQKRNCKRKATSATRLANENGENYKIDGMTHSTSGKTASRTSKKRR
jgi:hypothetical protein